MFAAIREKLKGWKTIIWADFLMAVGIICGILVPLLDAFDATSIGAIIPPKFAPFAPVILVLIGQITKTLRKATTGPVGAKGDEAPAPDVKAGD